MLNPHHGLAWIAGHMKSNGHDVRCAHIRQEEEVKYLKQEIKNYSPDCIGFSLVTNQRQYLDTFVNTCREDFKGLIVVGGVHATLAPEDTLKCESIDGVCIGEGERSMVSLAEHIDKNKPYHFVPSFRWRNRSGSKDSFINNCVGSFESDISRLSYPDYSIFNMDLIIKENSMAGYMPIMISRGCPFVCTYCCNKAIKDVYPERHEYFRILAPGQAINLLRYLKERFAIKGFNFADDFLICNVNWFSKFTKKYVDKIKLPYVCNSRVEILQNKEIAVMLKESACKQVSFGIESGDEDYRKTFLKRNYSNRQILTASKLLHEVGIPFSTYNIMGFPFETKEQMEKTVKINKSVRPHSGMVFFFYPYPGTELYKMCVENNLLRPERMSKVGGFMERPVIKLTNCREQDCVKTHRKLFLYFKSRKAARLFQIDSSGFDNILYTVMRLAPKLFIYMARGKFVPNFLKRAVL
jgi:radical SAM superfamily enzyme YgiQ (UPF0313 family)